MAKAAVGAADEGAGFGPGCVKNPIDAMILRVNRQLGATDVRLRRGDGSEPEQFVPGTA